MTEPIAGPSGAGTVVLDLGAGIGVLVLYTPASMDGHEIEISRAGQAGRAADETASRTAGRTHSQVRRRDTMRATVYAAVYPCLPAGEYVIWRDDHRLAGKATITGGQVTTCEWPGLTELGAQARRRPPGCGGLASGAEPHEFCA